MARGRRYGIEMLALYLSGLILVATGSMSVNAATQAATPAGAGAAQCGVAPRRFKDVLALVPPPRGEGTPAPGHPVLALPNGAPADPATTAAIASIVRSIEACANAGDELRLLSFFSDDQIRRVQANGDAAAELAVELALAPSPIPAGRQVVILGPWHVERLADGRVLAAVVWFGDEAESIPDPSRVRALVFVQQNGRWLIDEMIDQVAAPGCAFPVPVAAAVGPPPGVEISSWPRGCG